MNKAPYHLWQSDRALYFALFLEGQTDSPIPIPRSQGVNDQIHFHCTLSFSHQYLQRAWLPRNSIGKCLLPSIAPMSLSFWYILHRAHCWCQKKKGITKNFWVTTELFSRLPIKTFQKMIKCSTHQVLLFYDCRKAKRSLRKTKSSWPFSTHCVFWLLKFWRTYSSGQARAGNRRLPTLS